MAFEIRFRTRLSAHARLATVHSIVSDRPRNDDWPALGTAPAIALSSALDDVVADRLQIVEDIVFECPPSSQRIPSLEYGYGEPPRVEAEVAVVLAIDSAAS